MCYHCVTIKTNHTDMTTQAINNERTQNGTFSTGNEACGWYAISRDGVHMITFYQGKFYFTQDDDVNRFYTEKGFANRVGQLIKRGY